MPNKFLYYAAATVCLAAMIIGFSGAGFWFIKDERSAAIVLLIAGMAMCSSGQLNLYVTKAPAHPFSILGYLIGTLALFAGIVQIFNIKVAYLSNPRNAMVVIIFSMIIKIIIGRLSFLLPAKKKPEQAGQN